MNLSVKHWAQNCLRDELIADAWQDWCQAHADGRVAILESKWKRFVAWAEDTSTLDTDALLPPEQMPSGPVSPAPQPVSPPVVTPTPQSVNPLTQMIITELEQAGYRPGLNLAEVQRLITAQLDDTIRTIRGTTTHIQVADLPAVDLNGALLPRWFGRLVRVAQAGVPALLVGPAGSGKSYAARLLAQVLDRPFTSLSLSAGTDEGALVGWLLPIEEAGRFAYAASGNVTGFEQGWVVCWDEMDAMDANVGMVCHEMLANGHLSLPLRLDNPVAVKHPDWVIVGCANTHGHGASREYVGRNQLDGATLSRFRLGQINTDFDPDLEAALFGLGTSGTPAPTYSAPPADLASVHRYGVRLRERIRSQQGWQRDVSTRDFVNAKALASVFGLAEEIWFGYFADWSADELSSIDVRVNQATETATLS